MSLLYQVRCIACRHEWLWRVPEIAAALRQIGMLKRGDLELSILEALAVSSAHRFVCPDCGHLGLQLTEQDPRAEEVWDDVRVCAVCKKPIAAERLEVLPHARHCTQCAASAGEA